MKERIANIRVMFVCLCGLVAGILFVAFNTFENFHVWKLLVFIFVILSVSSFLFVYGYLTKDKNSKYRARRKVSFLLMSSGVGFLLFSIIGVCVTIYPYYSVSNIMYFNNEVRVEGIVSDYVSDNNTYIKFVLDDCLIEYDGKVYESKYKISVYADVYNEISLGDKLTINKCILNKYSISKASDLAKLCKGIGYQTYVSSGDTVRTPNDISLRDQIKNKTKYNLDKNLNEDNAIISYAMLFGDKEGLSENLEDSFSYAGISHILAVSGLHVGVLASAILFILKKIKMNKYVRFEILSAILIFYAYLCSYSPSVCRSAIMTMLLALCGIFQIEYDQLSSLSIAGIIMLIFRPLNLLSLSFQLSYLSVFAIITFAPTILKILSKAKFPKWLASPLAIGFSTNLGILPVCANAFTKVSLLGIFTNLVVLPLFTVAYILIFFIIIAVFIWSGFGKILWLPNLFLHLIKTVADFSTLFEGLVFKTFQNGYLVLFFLCCAILLIHYLMVKRWLKLAIVMPLILITIIQFVCFNIEYTAKDNTLIFAHQFNSNVVFYAKDDKIAMIGSNIDKDNLLYSLKSLKIRKIDSIIAYDIQLNNLTNLKEIIKECNVGCVYVPMRYHYSELCEEMDDIAFYTEEVQVLDLALSEINYENQTIGVYLDIKEIGDILIPELKPTKGEGTLLCEEYSGVKYFYQPTITKNIDLDLLSAVNVITNGSEGNISLSEKGDVKLKKEAGYEV